MRNIASELRDIVFNGNDSSSVNEELNNFDKYFLEKIYPELKTLAQRGITSLDFEYTFQDFSPDVCRHVFEAYGFKCDFYSKYDLAYQDDFISLSWENTF